MEQDGPSVGLIDLIGRLVEPASPPPVSMMPQTAGWWVLLGLLLAALALLAWRALRRWRQAAYRRAALAALADAADDPAVISSLLRRTALAVWPRAEVAGLAGADWLGFLERTGGATWPDLAARALIAGPVAVRPAPSPELSQQAARWIRTHRAELAR